MQIVSTIEAKYYIAYIFISNIVVYKLSNEQRFFSIILLYNNKNLEVNFNDTILSLRLANYLKIKDNEKSFFYI